MKNFVLILFIAGIASCSQCYECSHLVETTVSGNTYIDTVTDEVCTADNQELKDLEADGYTCTSSI